MNLPLLKLALFDLSCCQLFCFLYSFKHFKASIHVVSLLKRLIELFSAKKNFPADINARKRTSARPARVLVTSGETETGAKIE